MIPMRMLPGFIASDEQTTVLDDLRSGRAGFLLRLGLSLAVAPVLVAASMFLLALVELVGSHVHEEHLAIAIGLSGAVWCGALVWVWSGYRRFARVIRSGLVILGTWVVGIPCCVLIVESRMPGQAEEFLIGGVIFAAIAVTIFVITTSVYQSIGGKPLKDRMGDVRVQCPTCGYSMVGLGSCRCPECGGDFTIDEIIIAQDYEALRTPAPQIDRERSDGDRDAGNRGTEARRALPDENTAPTPSVPMLPSQAGDRDPEPH